MALPISIWVASTLPFLTFPHCEAQDSFPQRLAREQILLTSRGIPCKMPNDEAALAEVPKKRGKIRISDDVPKSYSVNVHALFRSGNEVDEPLKENF